MQERNETQYFCPSYPSKIEVLWVIDTFNKIIEKASPNPCMNRVHSRNELADESFTKNKEKKALLVFHHFNVLNRNALFISQTILGKV